MGNGTEIMTKYLDAYALALSSCDVTRIAEFFDDGLGFSDYNNGFLHMDKAATIEVYKHIHNRIKGMKITTRNIRGNDSCCVWENTMEFIIVGEPFPGCPYGAGEKAVVDGVSLLTWTPEGQISKVDDYYNWVPKKNNTDHHC